MLTKISDHAVRRYLTRIRDVSLNATEMVQYIHDNNERIDKEIKKLFDFATCFYEGIIGKASNKPARFYINDDIILVTNRNGDELITIYKVNFNYGDDDEGSIDRTVARRLLNKIQTLHTLKEHYKTENSVKSEQLTYEVDSLKAQIKLAESTLNNLKNQLKVHEEMIKDINSNIGLVDNEIEQKCHQLINYVEYQKSLV